MERCKMFIDGRAYDEFIPKDVEGIIPTEKDYPNGRDVVLCEIPKGGCLYPGGEGQRCIFTDSNSPTGNVSVCNLDGFAKESDLVEKL